MSEPLERTPIATADLSVLLLVRNDAAHLEEVVVAWLDVLRELPQKYEVILVDDGSSDGTGVLADQLAERFPVVRVQHHTIPLGQGAALRTGLGLAQHPLLFYTLGNRQYRPSDVKLLLEGIDEVDVVTGIRVWQPMPRWVRVWDFLKGWMSRIIFGLPLEPRATWLGTTGRRRRLLARWILGVQVQDPECLFRLIRRDILRRAPLQSQGPLAHIELLAKVNFLGAFIAEVPVAFTPGPSEPDVPGELFDLLRAPDFGPTQLAEDSTAPAPASLPSLPEKPVNAPNL